MTWNTPDRKTFSNLSATPAAFTLLGGLYAIEIVATWGGGNVQLQRLSNDGSTYVNVGSSYTANIYDTQIYLPNGTYKLAITTATGVYAEIMSVAVVGPSG